MIKKNTLLFLSSEFLTKGTSFLSVLVVAHFFSKEIFGLLVLYFVAFELLTIVVSNGINACARIDYFEKEEGLFLKSYQAHLANSFLTSLVILIIGVISFQNYRIEIILLSLAAFLRTYFMLSLAVIQCKELALKYLKLNLFYTILYNSLFIILLFLGYTVLAWVYAIFSSYLLTSLFSVKFYSNNLTLGLTKLNIKDLKKQFLEGIIFLPQAIGFWSRTGSERFYLSIFLSLSALGVYSFNFQLSLPIVIFGTAINIYLTPIIAKLVIIKDLNRVSAEVKKYSYITACAAIAFLLIAYVISKTFFYDKYFDSFYLTCWLTLINLSYTMSLLFLNPLYYMGKKKVVSFIVLCYGLILTIANYFVVKYFKLEGLIFSTMVINFGFMVLSYIALNKNINKFKRSGIN
jgi:O-antigen/teichoic acid export membrane protein